MSSAWRFQSTYSLAPPPRSSRTRPATAIQRSSSSAPISLISIITANDTPTLGGAKAEE